MSQAVISEGLLGHCHELQAPALRGHWHSEMVTQKTITAPQPLPELQFNIFFFFFIFLQNAFKARDCHFVWILPTQQLHLELPSADGEIYCAKIERKNNF